MTLSWHEATCIASWAGVSARLEREAMRTVERTVWKRVYKRQKGRVEQERYQMSG